MPEREASEVTLPRRVEAPQWPAGDGWPVIEQSEWLDGNTLRLSLLVADDNTWFEGHFPGHPVLPGIVQLHWAVGFARAAWPGLGGAPSVDNLKFRQPVLPGMALVLTLERRPAAVGAAGSAVVRFALDEGENPCASGRVGFE